MDKGVPYDVNIAKEENEKEVQVDVDILHNPEKRMSEMTCKITSGTLLGSVQYIPARYATN